MRLKKGGDYKMKASVVIALAAILLASLVLENEEPGLIGQLACAFCRK